MRVVFRAKLAVGLVAVWIVSGCTSGGSSGPSTSTSPPSAASVGDTTASTSSSAIASSAASASSGSGAAEVGGSTSPSPTGSSSSAASTADGGKEQFTPIVMNVRTAPQWFTGSDGKVHLVYELELLNAFPVAVTVTRIVVQDAATGRALADMSGAQLSSEMSLLVPATATGTKMSNAQVGAAWMDVVLDDPARIPRSVVHQLTVAVPPGLPVPQSITYRGGEVDVDRTGPTKIGPPLEGPGWIAVGSCCDGPHRRSAQPINGGLWLGQRFAIDFNRVNDKDELAAGDIATNASWFTYDQPVLAVADATVVAAVDTFRDQIPEAPKPVTIDEADGNHIILKISDGVYAFYAHLKPGSVSVKPGDTVKKGQVIARTGNSGSSTGPHLHFQLMDRPSALLSNGRPYVFDSFAVTGKSPAIPELVKLPPTAPLPLQPAKTGPRHDELPLSSDIVTFASL